MPNSRIMPLGDSITQQDTSYRFYLYHALVGSQINFVGSQSSATDPTPDKDNEGHAGFTLAQLNANVATYLTNNPADVVLLYAGINDVVTETSLAPAERAALLKTRLHTLLGTAYDTDSDLRFVVAQIAPFQYGNPIYDSQNNRDSVTAFNAEIPGVVREWRARGKRIQYVDCNTGYNYTDWFSDEIHPDTRGWAFIAHKFFIAMATTTLAAIQDQLASTISSITPWTQTDKKFHKSPSHRDLREWATGAGSAAFRKYQIRTTGAAEEGDVLHPNMVETVEEVTITVAYPSPFKQPGLYRASAIPDDIMDAEELMRRDAQSIRNALRDTDNYLRPAHIESAVTIQAPDTSDDVTWYQPITVAVRYYAAT